MEDDKRGDRNLAKAEAARRLARLQQGTFWIGTERTLTKRRHYNLVFLHARRKTFPAFADIATVCAGGLAVGRSGRGRRGGKPTFPPVSRRSGGSGDLEGRGRCSGTGTSAGRSGAVHALDRTFPWPCFHLMHRRSCALTAPRHASCLNLDRDGDRDLA